jgi:glycosyltransferase involved in cell wall biosynthesis
MAEKEGGRVLSVVIPIYNEKEVLPVMKERLDAVLSRLDMKCEVILVDDGSRDSSASLIRFIASQDSRYKGLILSRNYGHQVALTAGLDHALGDAVVVLDADLQDPPELIPEMIERWRSGFEVVYGERLTRSGDSLAKRGTASLFYRLMRAVSGVEIPRNVGDFRLMDRKVVEALKLMPEHFRFVRGMVAWVGFRQEAVLFHRAQRAAGITKYPWRRMIRFALDAIFAFSVVPLRIITGIGTVVTLVAIEEIIRTLYLRFVWNATIPGFSALFVAVLALGGLNLLFLGIVGEYIGRIYVEAKRRPLYFVQDSVWRGGS